MDFLFGVVFFIVVAFAAHAKKEGRRALRRAMKPPAASPQSPAPTPQYKPTPLPQYNVDPKPDSLQVNPATEPLESTVLHGSAYVVDGDTVVIRKTQIRLFGVDAPEMNHPHGKKAKWALVALCKGQSIRAEVTDVDAHGRTVARCSLPDGRDLSAEMVKQGLAIDWPKYSGGIYRSMEVTGVRKKLWLADARQKGRMHVWEQFDANQKARNEKG